MPLEKDKSEEFTTPKSLDNKISLKKEKDNFITGKLVDRIIALKGRLDRLIILYVTLIILGIIYDKNFKKVDFIWNIKITEGNLYHIIVVLALTLLFSLIGFHLIEYSVKRNLLDKMLLKNNFFDDENKISKTLIPSSFYELMYSIDIYTTGRINILKAFSIPRIDILRELSILMLLTLLYLGHGVSFIHLGHINFVDFDLKTIENWMHPALMVIISLHYYVFIKSHDRARESLGFHLFCRVIAMLVVTALMRLILT